MRLFQHTRGPHSNPVSGLDDFLTDKLFATVVRAMASCHFRNTSKCRHFLLRLESFSLYPRVLLALHRVLTSLPPDLEPAILRRDYTKDSWERLADGITTKINILDGTAKGPSTVCDNEVEVRHQTSDVQFECSKRFPACLRHWKSKGMLVVPSGCLLLSGLSASRLGTAPSS